MPLEAVMVVVDNSESSRNGDYTPTRFGAQRDAVNIVFQSIINGNPESSVGLMSMSGNAPEVLSTLTTEQGRILEGLHRTQKKIGGELNLATGIQVASLALKHRQNKTQRQRIVAFVCSPVTDSDKALDSLAKKLKKASTSVDFILFGEPEGSESHQKLVKFNETVKSGEGSNLVTIPAGVGLLSDALVSSPIMQGEGGGAGGAGGGAGGEAGGDFGEFGFDPNNDPELALALRMSMEEEQTRRDRQAREEAAPAAAPLDSVTEEDESSKPLLDKDGEPSGSGSGSGSAKDEKKDDDKKDGDKSGDKMDIS